jgi:outer membrane murein-binding lipoprotein Lpp
MSTDELYAGLLAGKTVEQLHEEAMSKLVTDLTAERDALRAERDAQASAHQAACKTIEEIGAAAAWDGPLSLPRFVAEMRKDRDRLRAALEEVNKLASGPNIHNIYRICKEALRPSRA